MAESWNPAGRLRISAAGAWRPITGRTGKWTVSRVGVGGGRSAGGAAAQHNLRGGKGRCFVGAREVEEGPAVPGSA